ncbi:MAG: alkaline phosphatase family protein [Candidatus Saccharibacteria bacterium]
MARLLWILFLSFSLSAFSQPIIPAPDHVVILVMENHSYNQVIGSGEAPYINLLAKSANTALFTQSFGITYSSQPNYIVLFSGCNQGIVDDNPPPTIPFTSDNLGRQLLNAGKTFISYSEDLPYAGYDGETSGDYVRRHNPAVFWIGSGVNQIPPGVIQPFSSFPENFDLLPTVSFVVPGNNNNMHDGSIAQGDKWVYTHLFNYIHWAKTHNSLFILTFDEDDKSQDNQVPTLLAGQMVKSGSYSQKINHLNILRTIEDMYRLPSACDASKVEPLSGCWDVTINNHSKESERLAHIIPNPGLRIIKIMIPKDSLLDDLKFSLINIYGKKVRETAVPSPVTSLPTNKLSAGVYIYRLTGNNKLLQKGKIVIP